MTAIANSTATLTEGQAGSWFTPTGTMFLADVDTTGAAMLQTRRDANDSAVKPLADGLGNSSVRVLNGPCSVPVQCVAGRQYRFVSARGTVTVAADQ